MEKPNTILRKGLVVKINDVPFEVTEDFDINSESLRVKDHALLERSRHNIFVFIKGTYRQSPETVKAELQHEIKQRLKPLIDVEVIVANPLQLQFFNSIKSYL